MPLLDSLPPLPERGGDRLHLGGLPGSSPALLVAESAAQSDGFTLLVTANADQAQQMERELRYFLAIKDTGAGDPLPVLHFPAWETLPYDRFSPHQDIVSERLATLYQLMTLRRGVLVLPVASLMNRLPARQWLEANSLVLDPAHALGTVALRQQLERCGYHCVNTVYEHGEFAVRGSLVDVFPMGSEHPFRIDFLGDEIDSIRRFDPETQRTIEKVPRVSLLPAREYPLDRAGIERFCNRWHEQFPDKDAKRCPVYQDVRNGIAPPGVEYFLPLFFEENHTTRLLDFLPGRSRVFLWGDVEAVAKHHWQDIDQRFEEYNIDSTHPLLPPVQLFVRVEEIFQQFRQYPQVYLANEKSAMGLHSVFSLPDLTVQARKEKPAAQLQDYLQECSGRRILFSVDSAGRREALLEFLLKFGCAPRELTSWADCIHAAAGHYITVAPVAEGFATTDFSLITENELFGKQVLQERRRQQATDFQQELVIRSLNELTEGVPVVHIDHGIGRYRGMVSLKVDGQDNEFILMEYADQAKLYIPVSSLHLISRYSGADEQTAPLHRLGSEQWQKAKRKAAEQVRDVAAELLDVYARRAARKGYSFQDPKEDLAIFSAEFPFEETADQHLAIQSVLADMMSGRPMDRLVCGDVGFGKTEVAMRAAFVAVHNKKQVAVLVPTTLLAQQHYENFKDRFANWPVRIEVISRFRSAAEQKQILQDLAAGKIDILIGTHKLLGGGMDFRHLGLVVIDEEHRFGVQQKERLKSLRSEVDILTLTATPIPRTLNMAMSGMRELSIIATPPAKRLSVKTFIRQKDNAILKEAMLRELLRGGQVFYLHNDIDTIEKIRADLEQLVPEARIAVGHGQMRERDLEKVMADFYHKRFNVLVCTTIIETGIDVPSANTIIIERADRFGLAQLHQLRGRVGRSHHQAYAYLLTPDKKSMTPDALKRLEAISASETLGSGFTLATHDLEIRGAGELLGEEQSGQIQSIGFSLYMEMLERAVEAIRQGKTLDIEHGLQGARAEVNLHIPALIPDSYLPDPQNRLILYKRIASCRSEADLEALQVEMIDRFGLLPESTRNLFRLTRLRQRLELLGIKKLEANAKGGRIEFESETGVDPLTIVKMVQNQPQRYQMQDAIRLRFIDESPTLEDRFRLVESLLDRLQKGDVKVA